MTDKITKLEKLRIKKKLYKKLVARFEEIYQRIPSTDLEFPVRSKADVIYDADEAIDEIKDLYGTLHEEVDDDMWRVIRKIDRLKEEAEPSVKSALKT